MSDDLAGIEGLPGAHYVACDRCGYLWDIDAAWPDPVVCPACQARALWRFPTEEAARQYARDLHGATT